MFELKEIYDFVLSERESLFSKLISDFSGNIRISLEHLYKMNGKIRALTMVLEKITEINEGNKEL